MDKDLKDYTFDELVKEALRHLHDALLQGGIPKMHGRLYLFMDLAIQWREEREKQTEKKK